MALDRHRPAEINARIEQLGLDRERLWIGVGAGFESKPLTTMREALPELREAIPGTRLVLAAMGPRMCALAGSGFDGAFFNWMLPEFAARAREQVHAGASDAGREPPPVFGYVRTAVGDDAAGAARKGGVLLPRSARGYRSHFERLGRAARAPSASPPRTRGRPMPSSAATRRSTWWSSAAWRARHWRR